MPRAAHPGRGDATILAAALQAARRPAELSLTDTVDLLGTDLVQTENPDTGQVTSDYLVVTPQVPARIEPEQRAAAAVVVGGDEAVIERWIVELPSGTPCNRDQHIDVTTSTNPRLQGVRLRVLSELDSTTEPLRRLQAVIVNRGEP